MMVRAWPPAFFALFCLGACAPNGKAAVSPLAMKAASTDASQDHRAPAAEQLFALLRRLAASDELALGHQDALMYGIGWSGEADRSDVRSLCGSHPAVVGFDLGGLGNAQNLDGVPFSAMRAQIEVAHARGAIVTVSWHVENPVSGGDAWDTTAAVAQVLPGGSHHDVFLEKLERVASFLASCRAQDGSSVPLLFRPFHESNGNWFWWGTAHTSREDYVSLFQFTVDYLRRERGLHQLLFAFSPGAEGILEEADLLERYPGDRVVDVLGIDAYWGEDSSQLLRAAEVAVRVASARDKVAALTEFGALGGLTPSMHELPEWFTRSFFEPLRSRPELRRLAYALAWRNANSKHFFLPYPGHVAAPELERLCSEGRLLLERDLAPLRDPSPEEARDQVDDQGGHQEDR